MARRRFFVDAVSGGRATLEGADARHMKQVLRAKAGQRYELSDNRAVYLAEVIGFAPDRVTFRLLEELPPPPEAVRLRLLLALIKFDRFEWALEKATELGVESIVPVRAERSESGLDRAAEKRLERWRRIVRESSQQARRARLPEVLAPAEFHAAAAAPKQHAYFLDEQPGVRPVLAALPAGRTASDEVSLLVGPEGGWTEAERTQATVEGWIPVSLGWNVLRAETAAIAGLAVLGAAWQAMEY